MLKHTQPRLSQLASAVAVVLGGITLLPAAHAAAPAAGVSISNIAVASYNDATGAPQTVNSNEVRTTVLQVASFTLEADRTATVNPNGQVALSHTLTNTGNGSDSFTISLVNLGGDDINLNNIAVYIDANGDGVADNTTNLVGQAVSVAAGQSVNLIVVGTAPIAATTGQAALLSISATSVLNPAANTAINPATTRPFNVNQDRVTITGNAVVNVTKAANVSAVSVGDTVEYTLTYSNTGNTTATDVIIRDLLPANVTYVANSARWSNTAPAALTDGVDAADAYSFNASTGTDGEVLFTIPSLPANTTGTLRFSVTIDTTAPAGAIVNQGRFSFDPDGAGATVATPLAPTNNTTVTVEATRLGTINDSTDDPFADGATPGTGATPVLGDTVVDDSQTDAVVPQGGTATFPVVVHNTGNVSQVYEVTVNQADLPTGSSVQVLRNGAPLTNISGTTAVDVGPIAVGDIAELSVVITLPAGFSETGLDTSDTIVTISPVGNELAVDSTILVIDDVLPATVDLSNGNVVDYLDGNIETAEGEGPYDPAIIVDAASTTPGVPVTFPVEIYNGGNSPDNFNLTANVPAGWTVVFQDPVTGQVVTNSGNIPAGATRDLIAIVTPPNNALVDPTNDVILTVTSPVSGLADSIKNNVAITEVRALNFTPDRQGQVAPGGTVTYVHTLTNNGNVTEGDTLAELPIVVSTTGNIGTIVTVGIDLNGDGELAADGSETVQLNDLNTVLPTGLAPFTSYTVLVKVQAPGSAQPGQQDITTVAVNPVGSINGVAAPASVQITDTTTVTAGQIRLVKTQAVDTDCDGVADAAYGQGTIAAQPGQCVVYRIVATNEGNAAVTNVVITDATPAFTTIDTVATNTPSVPANISSPAVGATGTVTDNVGSLAPAATSQIDFGVKIDE
ncbi:MAG: hypothetical protein WA154_13050 [Moraxellaceae bacterium]